MKKWKFCVCCREIAIMIFCAFSNMCIVAKETASDPCEGVEECRMHGTDTNCTAYSYKFD